MIFSCTVSKSFREKTQKLEHYPSGLETLSGIDRDATFSLVRSPFFIFRHYATYQKLQKNSKKNFESFFIIRVL